MYYSGPGSGPWQVILHIQRHGGLSCGFQVRMSGLQKSIFFLGLPDLKKLCCVSLSLRGSEEPRSSQIKTCRQLVLLYSDILASPALDSFTDITVVMAIQFFQKGILQAFAHRHSLQLGSPQCVFPGILQCCVSYSLICRLTPSWNKAGPHLVTGKDFLTERGRQNAVSLELSTSEGQLCLSVEANSVRLPPIALEDFALAPLVLRRFCSDPTAAINPSAGGGNIWCHVLPSMKKGQIISISRQLPKDGPFTTYRDLQNHWSHLYGYRLPEVPEEEVVYCSVYFRLVGERLFTYPLSCVRLQPLQILPRVDLQGALCCFLSDTRKQLQSVCGLPATLTGKPCYSTVSLSTASTLQVMKDRVNLSSSSSMRQVLTQLPPSRPIRPFFGSQPPSRPPQGLLAASLPAPRFSRRPAHPLSDSLPNLKHVLTLSPVSKHGLLLLPPRPKPAIKPKRRVKFSSDANAENASSQSEANPPGNRNASSQSEGVAFESKPKKHKSAVQDVDVEQIARSNQLAKLNAATLSSWLRGRGVHVSSRVRKEDLMLKVMGCLAEA
ncbi:hypothetical protein CgunFtcFv8_015170 [Champsocephalus gunnari]|uniref:DUF4708 domain-containing protein n=1 Tax=Champsocephalus gunnari TaxID=52237 RepID=A0AAN8C9J3_CHAGU|nr:hypothetical protein CgunFtcFv8_015170 [Champsocephalus gunnari]